MPNSDFQERLKRIENKSATPPQRPAPEPSTGKREKLKRALDATDRSGISRAEAYPAVLQFLFKLGFTPKPMPYWSALSLSILGGGVIFLIFGGVLYSEIGSSMRRGPIAGLHSAGWGGVYAMTAFVAILFPAYIKVRARIGNLPKWRDI